MTMLLIFVLVIVLVYNAYSYSSSLSSLTSYNKKLSSSSSLIRKNQNTLYMSNSKTNDANINIARTFSLTNFGYSDPLIFDEVYLKKLKSLLIPILILIKIGKFWGWS